MARLLGIILAIMGIGMFVIGLDAVFRGADSIPGSGIAAPNIDSEVRFYGSWYAIAGVSLFIASRNVERASLAVVAVAAGFLLAAIGRVISMVTIGEPEPLQKLLTVVEFVIPLVVVPWQVAVSRRPHSVVRDPLGAQRRSQR